jgi:type 1 glutamine amidotransferase
MNLRTLALALLVVFMPARGLRAHQQPRVLAFYSPHAEGDHVAFAQQAIQFFTALATKDHFQFQSTTNWDDLNPATLQRYQLVLWLNDSAHTPAQRTAFEHYMEHGGAWLGFHAAGYNDKDTGWPWYVSFLGGAVFYSNNWPPLPAQLTIDDPSHPIARGVPAAYRAPANEWYIWKPDPRLNPQVKVLLTLDPSNYPLGLKDTLTAGDLPVVWTNTRYHMLYMNMGHGNRIFDSEEQNRLFENALLWLAQPSPSTRPATPPPAH